jgi:hypothetical protein
LPQRFDYVDHAIELPEQTAELSPIHGSSSITMERIDMLEKAIDRPCGIPTAC